MVDVAWGRSLCYTTAAIPTIKEEMSTAAGIAAG
jgi:hypothetical protein